MNSLKLNLRYFQSGKRAFYDFIIDGNSLFDLCKINEKTRIGLLGSFLSTDGEIQLINQYLNIEKPEDFENGRIIMFGCSECGDPDCGAVTLELNETSDSIIWQKLGNEDLIEGTDLTPYEQIGPFEFSKPEYIRLFNEYKKTFSRL